MGLDKRFRASTRMVVAVSATLVIVAQATGLTIPRAGASPNASDPTASAASAAMPLASTGLSLTADKATVSAGQSFTLTAKSSGVLPPASIVITDSTTNLKLKTCTHTLTFGGVDKLDNLITPGASCTYAKDGYYLGGSGAAIAAATILTGGLGDVAEGGAAAETGGGRTLFHYTTEEGQKGILDSGQLNPSLRSVNPNDARYGNGQYLSDIAPGTKTSAQLSRAFLGLPFQGARFTHYVEIDVSGLNVIQGRPGVSVIPNEGPLDLWGRIAGFGAN